MNKMDFTQEITSLCKGCSEQTLYMRWIETGLVHHVPPHLYIARHQPSLFSKVPPVWPLQLPCNAPELSQQPLQCTNLLDTFTCISCWADIVQCSWEEQPPSRKTWRHARILGQSQPARRQYLQPDVTVQPLRQMMKAEWFNTFK